STFNKMINWRIRLTNPIGRNEGEVPKLATRRQELKPLSQQQFSSPVELTEAAVVEVLSDVYDEEADDIFYADDVI
ncbi:hypothetical protein, partial [Streptococcus suis]